ncbi:LHFPL tetraspan subfamily member 3 protein [Daphnia magna]|uniref:Uncharacterized protein n=1 Tax=Daphnia magna TaxID=35525 RepID=A0ABQ9ZC91_9CRUS|nr:LHFPL tetraspan subfamily member 3 protein [Daphnia magna]KAK4010528.1 hypothetical protein OUZ56_019673 [Daphnia magna]
MVASVAQVEFIESSQMHTSNYLRSSKAVGVLWGVFTFCFAIIDVVVFIQPQWIGDTVESKGTGYFGLWKHCSLVKSAVGQEIICKGQLEDFNTILNPAFRAATVFVGLSVVIIVLCLCAMLFFFFFSPSTVFHICGWLQFFSGAFLIVGVLAFPGGWSDPSVQEVCGPSARHFYPGQCGLRWAYILAMIGVADVLVLAALAFTLAVRHVKLLSLQPYPIIYKGEVNQGYVNDGQRSRRSSAHTVSGQSVAMFPHPGEVHDRMPEYGTPYRAGHRSVNKPPSAHSYRPEYASSNQHRFHL